MGMIGCRLSGCSLNIYGKSLRKGCPGNPSHKRMRFILGWPANSTAKEIVDLPLLQIRPFPDRRHRRHDKLLPPHTRTFNDAS